MRYDGEKRIRGFRLVVEGAAGEVLETRDMGCSISDPPSSVDRVVVATLELLRIDARDRHLLTLRFASLSGDETLTARTFVDEFIPSDSHGTATYLPDGPTEVGESEGLPVFRCALGQSRQIRIEFYVE